MSTVVNPKLQLLGHCVRACLKGHLTTVLLTDYDLSSDSYYGESHRNFSMNTGENPPVVESVRGLRPYPYPERPDYAFQFVFPGEDEQPLLDIAQGNVHLPANFNSPEQVKDRVDQINQQEAQKQQQSQKQKHPKH